jgi:[acyl-carrier-protein] S-malonyltransferase
MEILTLGKTAIVFPGQCAQTVGMGRDVADACSEAREVFSRADDILGMGLSQICFEGPADRLNATDVSQPAIFVTSVAIWRVLELRGMAEELAPAAMAGLSLGEYTALHLGGWIGFDECLRLVAHRGRLMQDAAEACAGGMVSIMQLDEVRTAMLCEEAALGDVLTPANYNCPGQIVISGDKAACERAVALADKYDARAVPLVVAGAFHSELMRTAADRLEPHLKAAKFTPGRIPVVSNVSADYHGDPDRVRNLLQEQVAMPIRWQASMERLLADGFDRFAEVGPGRVLSGLMRKIARSAKMLNYSAASSLEQLPAPEGRP